MKLRCELLLIMKQSGESTVFLSNDRRKDEREYN
jgi:hypothetical protein